MPKKDAYDIALVWLTFGLVAVGAGTLYFVWDQSRKIARSTAAAEKSADAQIRSDRAWVFSELIPMSAHYPDGWYRFIDGRRVKMNQDEVLRGNHLKYTLKFTNMGRTPAHILEYEIRFWYLGEGVREMPKTPADSSMNRSYDRLLGGGDHIDVFDEVIEVFSYIKDYIRDLEDLKTTAVFQGWVAYQHVFSDTEIVKEHFRYVYSAKREQLLRSPITEAHR